MVVRNHAERSRQLQTYMRTNLEEIQWAKQTDATLTKIKARGEQRIERSKRRPRTSMVAVGYACRCANLRPKSNGPKGVCGVVGGGPGANAVWAKRAPLKHRFAVIAPTVSPAPEPSSHRMTQLVFGTFFECRISTRHHRMPGEHWAPLSRRRTVRSQTQTPVSQDAIPLTGCLPSPG